MNLILMINLIVVCAVSANKCGKVTIFKHPTHVFRRHLAVANFYELEN